MSNYRVIADVSETLRILLWNNMEKDTFIKSQIVSNKNAMTLSSPKEMLENDDLKLCLYLYQVVENPHLKNQEMQDIDSVKLKHIPLVLDLFYLITPNTGDETKNHYLLGKVMQIFHDNPILKGSILAASLAGTTEELHVTLYSLPFDEMIHLWQSFSEKSFKLSICYQVTPVRIESTREIEVRRVLEKEAGYYQMSLKKEK